MAENGIKRYNPVSEESKMKIAWAAFMHYLYDEAWGTLVNKIQLTAEEHIQKELLYIEMQKWNNILNRYTFAEMKM